ncbi:MAG: hypothetical protein M1536_03950 [Firmicutes bacterium]|nr:hypothetical protein [Bacillota bacterium]
MTAEIVIMNKEAIAFAADSAVTITEESGQKIFTSANKLFALSKYHPVGIMVYGSALFMGVPWETVIKIYRKTLGKKRFDILDGYVTDFIAFLENGNTLFPDLIQKQYLRNTVYSYLNYIKVSIASKIPFKFAESNEISEEEIEKIVSETIKEHLENWEKAENIESIPKSFNEDIIIKYGKIINKAIEDVFERLPISQSHSDQLKKIVASLFSKFPEGLQKEDVSGVVIAGFGEKDTFPVLESCLVEGIVNNKLKYKRHIPDKVGFKISALIIPFAQSEMVETFMEGINPGLRNRMEGHLSEIFDKYPEVIAESIDKYNEGEKKILKKKLKEISNKIFKDYQEGVHDYREENHVNPVIRVVSMLPKDELAAMAESLVNLTSFKRKVTMETETVGGPIDVAVISKGDGFVWIKRKHYFKAEQNPQFFANYYMEV